MAKIPQALTVMRPGDDLAGMVLIETTDPNLIADGKNIIKGPSGKYYYLAGGKTVPSTKAELKALPKVNTNLVYHSPDNGPQFWMLDPNDVDSADNGGTIAVTDAGERVKAKFNGDIHAKWFGVTPSNPDNSDALQAALDAASTINGCGVQLLEAGTFNITKQIIIPAGVHLHLGGNTTIANNNVADYAMFRIKLPGKIKGGTIQLGSALNVTGILIWAGDNTPRLEAFCPVSDIQIIGPHYSGSVGIHAVAGTDIDFNPIPDYQEMDLLIYDNVGISSIEKGIWLQQVGTNAFLNGHVFRGNIKATQAVTAVGAGHKFYGQVESEVCSYIGPNPSPIHYVAKFDDGLANTSGIEFNMYCYDFVAAADNSRPVIGYARESSIKTGNGNPSREYGWMTEDHLRADKLSFPTSEQKFRTNGDLENLLLWGHKKYTVSTDSADLTPDLDILFQPLPLYHHIPTLTDCPTGSEKTITIDLGGWRDIRVYGVSFRLFNPPDYLKMEHYDGTNWITDSEMSGIYIVDPYCTVSSAYAQVAKVYQLRFTFSRANCSASLPVCILRCFAYDLLYDPGAIISCGGGTIYGDLNLNGIKSAGILSTDANGKIVKGWSGDAVLAGDNVKTEFTVPYDFGSAPSHVIVTPTNEAAALAQFYLIGQDANGFTLKVAGATPPANATINWIAN